MSCYLQCPFTNVHDKRLHTRLYARLASSCVASVYALLPGCPAMHLHNSLLVGFGKLATTVKAPLRSD